MLVWKVDPVILNAHTNFSLLIKKRKNHPFHRIFIFISFAKKCMCGTVGHKTLLMMTPTSNSTWLLIWGNNTFPIILIGRWTLCSPLLCSRVFLPNSCTFKIYRYISSLVQTTSLPHRRRLQCKQYALRRRKTDRRGEVLQDLMDDSRYVLLNTGNGIYIHHTGAVGYIGIVMASNDLANI